MAMTKLKVAIVAYIFAGIVGAGTLTAAGLDPALRAQAAGRAAGRLDPPRSAEPRSEPPPIGNAKTVDPGQVRQKKTNPSEPPKRGVCGSPG